MNKKLQAKIDNFLLVRRKSVDMGWSPVEDGDQAQLRDILIALIEAKWEADPDGDTPIDFLLVDRTKFLPVFWRNVPYPHNVETAGDYADYESAVLSNLTAALSDAKNLSGMRFQRVSRDQTYDAISLTRYCTKIGLTDSWTADVIECYFDLVARGLGENRALKSAKDKADEASKIAAAKKRKA